MHTLDSFVVERFITAVERGDVGPATQAQVFRRVKGILKGPHRRGIIGLDPLLDVSPPEYRPGLTVIPTKEQVRHLRAARDRDAFRLVVDLMAGTVLRNGEALAVKVNNDRAAMEERVGQFTPFLRFDTEIRRIVCTTHAIESVNARIRRAVTARGHFSNEQAELNCVYMAIMSLDHRQGQARWTMRWKTALNTFDITFDGRLSAARQ